MTWFRKTFDNRCKVARELDRLTDRQLQDIGLTRGDLDKMIKEKE